MTEARALMPGDQIGPYFEHIPEQRLKAFCQAVGAEYLGVAPPTFMTVFRRGEFDLIQRKGVGLSSVLHAEQEYEYFSPILPDMKVEFKTEISKSFQKKGSTSALHFLVFETQVKESESGTLLGLTRTTLVIRGGAQS